jgi:hypothetical protein
LIPHNGVPANPFYLVSGQAEDEIFPAVTGQVSSLVTPGEGNSKGFGVSFVFFHSYALELEPTQFQKVTPLRTEHFLF